MNLPEPPSWWVGCEETGSGSPSSAGWEFIRGTGTVLCFSFSVGVPNQASFLCLPSKVLFWLCLKLFSRF